MKIAFCLPVHERNDVICNVIENIQKFVKDPLIIIHVNKFWDGFDNSIPEKYENVYVNPDRVFGVKFESQLPLIISNFEFAKQFGFDYYCIFHTNEMFIKSGLENYISDNEMSHHHFPNVKHQNTVNVLNNTNLLDLVPVNHIFNNHVEGNFFKKELFQTVIDYIKTEMPNMINFKGAVEETLIPTLAYHFTDKNKVVLPYLRSFYHENLQVNEDVIKTCLQDKLMIKSYYDIPMFTNMLFSVKPINRDINDPVRNFINNLESNN